MNGKIHSGIFAAVISGFLTPQAVYALSPVDLGGALTDEQLSELRGGFVTLDNLEIAIGLEQLVAVDGETLVLNRLTIPNLNQVVDGGRIAAHVEQVVANARPNGNGIVVTAPQPAQTQASRGSENGSPSPGSVANASQSSGTASAPSVSAPLRVSSELHAGSWMTIIQNRLDGKVIQNIQQLNIELNNLGAAYRLPQGIRDSLPMMY
ncbi:hypothetical protein GCM10009113_15690 [Marinobacter szutsaonensis]